MVEERWVILADKFFSRKRGSRIFFRWITPSIGRRGFSGGSARSAETKFSPRRAEKFSSGWMDKFFSRFHTHILVFPFVLENHHAILVLHFGGHFYDNQCSGTRSDWYAGYRTYGRTFGIAYSSLTHSFGSAPFSSRSHCYEYIPLARVCLSRLPVFLLASLYFRSCMLNTPLVIYQFSPLFDMQRSCITVRIRCRLIRETNSVQSRFSIKSRATRFFRQP